MPEINFFWDPLSDNILQERDAIGALTGEYTTELGLYGNVISQNRSGVAEIKVSGTVKLYRLIGS